MLLLCSLQGHMGLRACMDKAMKLEVTGHSQKRCGMVSILFWQNVQAPFPVCCLISLFVFKVPLFIMCWMCL